MTSIEQEEIRIEREVLKRREELLSERERELWKHGSNADAIVADEIVMKVDIEPEEVNYVLGQSRGFVDGFKSAIDAIAGELSSEYRDIPMTEHEIYMLIELGAIKERAWLKDYKQKQLIEKAGWQFDFSARFPIWKKKTEDEGTGE